MKTINHQVSKDITAKRQTASIEQNEYISTLENLLVFISQNVRQPIGHIQSLSYLHEITNDSPVQLNKKILQLKQSALLLENRTRELSIHIYKKVIKLKAQA